MWTPDVYEGSPTPVTAFFATVPKLAAIAMLARFIFGAFGEAVVEWQQILIFLSISSMLVGSIAAIGQNNIKRLMAYSSISHIGFALIGLAAGTSEGLSAVIIYICWCEFGSIFFYSKYAKRQCFNNRDISLKLVFSN